MTKTVITPVVALVALVSAQAAQAQSQPCVAAEDLSDAVVYVMPIAFDAARTVCANRLTGNGFMATKGDAYIAKFRAEQEQTWPGALRLIKTFMADKKGGEEAKGADIAAMIGNLPDSALRPFVDALVGQAIADEIKPDSCSKIERAVELVSPLPTENVGGLVAFLIEAADVKNPNVCTKPKR